MKSSGLLNSNILEWNDEKWDELYRILDGLMDLLVPPNDELSSFHKAVESARLVEDKALKLFAKVVRFTGEARRAVANQKLALAIQFRELFNSEGIKDLTKHERKLHADSCLGEETKKLDDAEVIYEKMTLYLDCVKRVINAANHHRADIAKRLKVMEIEANITR